MKSVIILGIDGATLATGVGVVEKKEGGVFVKTHALFVPPKFPFTKRGKMKKSSYERLHAKEKKEAANMRVLFMMERLRGVLESERFDKIVVEDSYGQKDIFTTKMLSRIHGYIIGFALERGIPCQVKAPSMWRKEVGMPLVGENKRPLRREKLKNLAMEKVRNLFGIEVEDDEADGILLALSGLED